MLRVTDLKAVVVATGDLDAAVAAFRTSFSFPVTRSTAGRTTSLGIGAAEIEMTASTDSNGLQELVLEVEDLAAARSELAARGIAVEPGTRADGQSVVRVPPSHTHGVQLVLVER